MIFIVFLAAAYVVVWFNMIQDALEITCLGGLREEICEFILKKHSMSQMCINAICITTV